MSVSELLQRFQAISPNAEVNWNQFRKDIVEEHHRATTDADRSTLVALHKSLMDFVERGMVERGVTSEQLEMFQKTRRQEYSTMLAQEAFVGEKFDEWKFAAITQREVEAGRMSPDDNLRKSAEKWQRDRTTLVMGFGENILYWLGGGIALAVLIIGGFFGYLYKLSTTFFIIILVATGFVWLLGRASRYVLFGK